MVKNRVVSTLGLANADIGDEGAIAMAEVCTRLAADLRLVSCWRAIECSQGWI